MVTTRLTPALYLASLALLPWSWIPPFSFPFSWQHEHAQWSDAAFGAATIAWAIERCRAGEWPRLRWIHAALAFYLVWAALSLLLASPARQAGALKLLGMAELCALVVITSDLASRPGMRRAIVWVVAITSLLTVIAAKAGLILFYAGVETRLVGSYGDLVEAKRYARVQAGLYHPNLLASYCIFAFSVVSRDRNLLPRWLWRAVWIGLCVTVVTTFSRAMLGFGLAMAIGAARDGIRRGIAWLYAAAAVALILALTVWNLSLDPSHPLAMRVNTAEPASRWQTMTSSWRTLAAHPLWGSGLGTSPGFHRNMRFDAHLTLLNIAATMGLPAALAFVSIVILLWRNRCRPTELALWGGMAGLALDSLAADIEEFRHVWVLFGLAARSPIEASEKGACRSRCNALKQ